MFSRYFRPFVPGFHVRSQNDLPGFNLDENSSPRTEPWRMPLGPRARRYPDAAPALMQQIFRASKPSPQLFAQSTPPTGLAGFRPTTQDDIPGFRLKDAVPGFNVIDNESGVQRQETAWSDATRPESRFPAWLYEPLTVPLPQLSAALDPQTGQRIVPYAPLISADGTYPTTSQNEDVGGSTRAYVDGMSAPPDLSSVAAPSAEERQPPDDDEWPSDDAEESPSPDTEAQSQAPKAAVVQTPSPQQTVQQATWETQLPRLTNNQMYPELGGNKKLDPQSAAMARLPGVVAAPSVRPTADNNFILTNARNDAMRQHASSDGGSPFGWESVYRIGANDAIPRRYTRANTNIQNSVTASFGSPAAPENTAYQSYGTNSAYPRPLEYRGQPFDVKVGNTYSPRNPPLHLADLSGANAQGTTSTSPLMSDAYPEPLISGAQYAQVIQQNNAVLHNPRIDRTTDRLLSVLTETVESLGPGSGPIFGIYAHLEFAKRVRELNIPGIRTEGVEQSFDLGDVVRYGLEGSVRTDVVLRDPSGIPIAVYDLKTGNAKLTTSRVQEIREAVGRPDIPVIELRYRSESAVLR